MLIQCREARKYTNTTSRSHVSYEKMVERYWTCSLTFKAIALSSNEMSAACLPVPCIHATNCDARYAVKIAYCMVRFREFSSRKEGRDYIPKATLTVGHLFRKNV